MSEKGPTKAAKLVIQAIKHLNTKTGFTPNEIIKYIKTNHEVNNSTIKSVHTALRRGENYGFLRSEGGRYVLRESPTLSQLVSGRKKHDDDSDPNMKGLCKPRKGRKRSGRRRRGRSGKCSCGKKRRGSRRRRRSRRSRKGSRCGKRRGSRSRSRRRRGGKRGCSCGKRRRGGRRSRRRSRRGGRKKCGGGRRRRGGRSRRRRSRRGGSRSRRPKCGC